MQLYLGLQQLLGKKRIGRREQEKLMIPTNYLEIFEVFVY